MQSINLKDFAGGALQEKFDQAFSRVLENMQDPNTPWKNKRNITIKVSLQQNEDRDDSTVDISVETKLAPVIPLETRIAIGKDLKTGKLYAEEYGKQVRGQLSLDDYTTQQEVDGSIVDTNTGEIINNLADFKAKEA